MMRKRVANKGYSMIELVVVVGIMAVAVTIVSLSLATIFSNNARQVGSSIDTLISRGRTNSVYRAQWVYIEIWDDGNGNYLGQCFEGGENTGVGGVGTPVGAEEVLGSTRVRITLEGFNSTTLPIRIAFQRGTGQMFEVTDFADFSSGNFPDARPKIHLGNSDRNFYTVELTPRTGNHSFGAS